MSEYELISLIQTHIDAIGSHIMNFVGIYFAIVVASYFVADKLPKLVIFGMIIMFSTFTILNLSEITSKLDSILRLEASLRTVAPHTPYFDPASEPWGMRPVSFLLTYFLGFTTAVGFPLYMAFRKPKQ